MTCIISGDIIGSSDNDPSTWIPHLKSAFNRYSGNSPLNWEIYRGDSFQLEVSSAYNPLIAALFIKAKIKSFKDLDVRLAIGMGDKTYVAEKITESNGSAFVHSGKCFDQLKKKTLAIKSSDADKDEIMNLMIQLAMLTADRWAPVTAEIVQQALLHPGYNQTQLAQGMMKSQSAISEGLKRAGFEEIHSLINYFEKLYIS